MVRAVDLFEHPGWLFGRVTVQLRVQWKLPSGAVWLHYKRGAPGHWHLEFSDGGVV